MDMSKVYEALKLAASAHKDQFRKGSNPPPYIVHPVFVGMILMMLGYSTDTVIAGILHDTLEDTCLKHSPDKIKRLFGERVLSLVEAVTEPKDPNMTKQEKEETYDGRKAAKLERLKKAPPEARAIVVVDMLSNMRDLLETFEEEGESAREYFNADLTRKLEHTRKELSLFESDTEKPFAKLIPELRELLKRQEVLADYIEKEKI